LKHNPIFPSNSVQTFHSEVSVFVLCQTFPPKISCRPDNYPKHTESHISTYPQPNPYSYPDYKKPFQALSSRIRPNVLSYLNFPHGKSDRKYKFFPIP